MTQQHFFLSPRALFSRIELIGQQLSKIAVIDSELIKLRRERRRATAAIRNLEPTVRAEIARELEIREGQNR
ncbi:MAG: hypothetical protein ABI036_07230 [Fibrobacteria bacterium]